MRFDNIDWTKALTFLLIFLGGTVLIVTVFLVPTIRDYKKQSGIYDVEYQSFSKVKEKYDEANGRLKKIKSDNAHLLVHLNSDFNETHFEQLALRHFKSFTIQKVGEKSEDGEFVFSDYDCVASMKEPTTLFKFLNDAKEFDAVIKIRTPLVMASSDGSTVMLGFVLRVYNIKKASSAPKHGVTAPAH